MSRIAFAPVLVLLLVPFAGCSDDGAATTRLEIRFAGKAADVATDVSSDLSSRPTQPLYDEAGIAHADGYTAHDQLWDWKTAAGSDVEAESFNGSFGAGFFLVSVAGVEADGTEAYWALSINGQESSVGMSDVVLHDGDTVTWTYTSVGAAAATDPDPIGVTVDPPAPTQGETATVTGSVNHDARVSLDGGPSIEAKAGRWTLTSHPLAYGQTQATVRVDDGVHSVAVPVTFTRLASATFEARFTAYPLHEDLTDLLWYDPSGLASAPMYEGKAAPRAPTFTVHDFMQVWSSQKTRAVTYSYSDSFGYGVEAIDGVGQPLDSSAPPYWCYKLDGESADLGISLQPLAPGSVVTWEYAGCM